EGNFLTHHLILRPEDLSEIKCNPFWLLDTIRLADPGTDLSPRILPPQEWEIAPVRQDYSGLVGDKGEFLAQMVIAALESRERSILLIGEERYARAILRSLFSVLNQEERKNQSFSTHFYQSDTLRSLYHIVSVASRYEAPARGSDYLLFDLECDEYPVCNATT